MNPYNVELNLYHECLYEIKRRIDVIASHINREITEKYKIVEVEFICLQFRKILEKIALMSLVANKEIYAEHNDKFRKHYHAERILNDLERINPNYYPQPIRKIEKEGEMPQIERIEDGYLTKDEFVKLYEKCGAMMHAQNPFADSKTFEITLDKYMKEFSEWLTKVYMLIGHHQIILVGGKAMVVGLLERSDNGLPQAVIFEQIE